MPEDTITGEKVTWREWRGSEHGWSKTLYSGVSFRVGQRELLVAKLSHGLRIIDFEHLDCNRVSRQPIEVPEYFVRKALRMLEEDMGFQKQLGAFEQLMGD